MTGKVAVWGATGFVGRHLVDALLERGVSVRALCRDPMQIPNSWEGKVEVRHLALEADDADFHHSLEGIACVIHCAGTPAPDARSLRIYEQGTSALARAAADSGVGSVILLSTVSVYGVSEQENVGVTELPVPDSAYGACRLRAEQLARESLGDSQTSLSIVRVPAVVGTGMQGTVLTRFQRGLRAGLFIHPGSATAGFPCIGVRLLANRLAMMAMWAPADLPPLTQIADYVRWTELVDLYEKSRGRLVARIPFPASIARGVSKGLPFLHLDAPLAALANTTVYRNEESSGLITSGEHVASTRSDIEAFFRADGEGGSAPGVSAKKSVELSLVPVLWLLFFIFSVSAALLFQYVLLPHIPALHGGFGLLKGDALSFHQAARTQAALLADLGWTAWTPWPTASATGNVGVLGGLYYLFGPHPALAIPINAVLHATSAILLWSITHRTIGGKPGWAGGLIASILFVIFPSALNWYGQIHKDGYAILGFLAYLSGLLYGLEGRQLRALVHVLAGLALTAFVRPNTMMLLVAAGSVLPAIWLFNLRRIPFSPAFIWIPLIAVLCTTIVKPPVEAGSNIDTQQYDKFKGYSNVLVDDFNQWHWQRTSGVPAALDRVAEQLATIRVGFIVYNIASGATSTIDADLRPASLIELIRATPRALQVALLAPFPENWLAQRDSVTRIVGTVETIIWYLMIPGLMFAMLRFASPRLALVIGVAMVMLCIEGLVTPNLGTLHRVRYPFLFSLLALGASGWCAWLPSFGRPIRSGLDRLEIPDSPLETSHNPRGRGLLGKSAGVLIFSAVGFLGLFARDLIVVHIFGLDTVADAFQLAMQMPMLLINLLAVPINATVIPIFLRIKGADEHLGRQWINQMAGHLLIAFSILAIIVLFACYWMSTREGATPSQQMALGMVFWLVPVVALSGVTVLANAISNAEGQPLAAAAAQICVPLTAILFLALFSRYVGPTAAVAGMAVGQVLNLLLLVGILRGRGWPLRPSFAKGAPSGGFFELYPSLVVASLISSAALPAGVALATMLPPGEISALTLGIKAVQFAMGLGVAILVAVILPHFSGLIVGRRFQEARRALSLFLTVANLGAILVAIATVAVAPMVVKIVFLNGSLGNDSVNKITSVLSLGMVQLPFFAITAVLMKYLIAGRRVGCLLVAGLLGLLVHLLISQHLMGALGAAGIALGISLGAMVTGMTMLIWSVWEGDLGWLDAVALVTSWLLHLALIASFHAHESVGLAIGALGYCLMIGMSVARHSGWLFPGATSPQVAG